MRLPCEPMQYSLLDDTVFDLQKNHLLSLSSYSVAPRRAVRPSSTLKHTTLCPPSFGPTQQPQFQREDDQKWQCKDYGVAREL